MANNRKYTAETITNTDYADDQALLTNPPAQAESLLHSLEQAPEAIGLYMNANKTEHIYFKQKGAISTQRGKTLKSVDQFTYLESNILSIESDVNIYLMKAWNTINMLLII